MRARKAGLWANAHETKVTMDVLVPGAEESAADGPSSGRRVAKRRVSTECRVS